MMRNYIFISFLFCSSLFLQSQNYYMSSPEGFGAATSGGGNATPLTVSTYTDLKASLLLPTPQVILVSGTITIPAGQRISAVITNKTLIGLAGARLVNNTQTQSGSGILNLQNGSYNVIIRNLIFEGPGAYDTDGRDNLTADGCVNLWVDHCEFQDGVDGNFDIRGNTDSVTVSWCKFTYLKPAVPGGPGGSNDHRFSNLVGSSDSDAPADGHFSVTFQNCYWATGCKERMPRARNAELHILNCYYNTDVSSSRALGISGGINNSTCYVENTDFASVGTVYQSYGGTVAVNFVNCLNGVSNVGTVVAPTYPYSTMPVAEVATNVPNANCGAGATLDVTPSGAISSPCDDLGLEDLSHFGITYFPTVIADRFNIDFTNSSVNQVEISFYDIKGSHIFSAKHDSFHEPLLSLDMSDYESGLYFCRLQINGSAKVIRVIKD